MDLIKPFIEHFVYPMMEVRRGNKIRLHLDELSQIGALPPSLLMRIQREKLAKLLHHCFESVPAYAPYSELDSEVDDDPYAVLQKLPVLLKPEYAKNRDSYFANGVTAEQCIRNTTGGSTAEPLVFYIDRRTVEYYEAARWRGLAKWGITPGSRSCMLWGSPIEMEKQKQKKYFLKEKYLKNRIAFPAYDIAPEKMSEYVKKINKYKPEYFYGYASVYYEFARLMKENGLKFTFKPKCAVSTAETLYDFQRKLISEVFGCPTVNEYGARDAGILAYECPEGHMHVTAENAVIEIVDPVTGAPCKNGEQGDMLITDLNNFSAPRLRYRVGDVGAISFPTENCKCSSGLPILMKLDGRVDDMFVGADGHLIHGHIFNHISKMMDVVVKFQITQTSRTAAHLLIVPRDGVAQEKNEEFAARIRDALPGIEVTHEYVSDIPAPKSGKFRYAIRAFEL